MDYVDLFDATKAGVFKIEFITDRKSLGGGSGFLVNDMLITNNHVYAGALEANENLKVKLRRYSGINCEYIEKVISNRKRGQRGVRL